MRHKLIKGAFALLLPVAAVTWFLQNYEQVDVEAGTDIAEAVRTNPLITRNPPPNRKTIEAKLNSPCRMPGMSILKNGWPNSMTKGITSRLLMKILKNKGTNVRRF